MPLAKCHIFSRVFYMQVAFLVFAVTHIIYNWVSSPFHFGLRLASLRHGFSHHSYWENLRKYYESMQNSTLVSLQQAVHGLTAVEGSGAMLAYGDLKHTLFVSVHQSEADCCMYSTSLWGWLGAPLPWPSNNVGPRHSHQSHFSCPFLSCQWYACPQPLLSPMPAQSLQELADCVQYFMARSSPWPCGTLR